MNLRRLVLRGILFGLLLAVLAFVAAYVGNACERQPVVDSGPVARS